MFGGMLEVAQVRCSVLRPVLAPMPPRVWDGAALEGMQWVQNDEGAEEKLPRGTLADIRLSPGEELECPSRCFGAHFYHEETSHTPPDMQATVQKRFHYSANGTPSSPRFWGRCEAVTTVAEERFHRLVQASSVLSQHPKPPGCLHIGGCDDAVQWAGLGEMYIDFLPAPHPGRRH